MYVAGEGLAEPAAAVVLLRKNPENKSEKLEEAEELLFDACDVGSFEMGSGFFC